MSKLAKNEKLLILLSLFLFISGTMSINIYLPSLLYLTKAFHTSIDNVKLSISLFLFSYAISQFVWGSLSEKIGRKKAIVIGLSIASVGTLIALCASNILLFNMARFVEGFGIGCSSVLARALLSDSLDKLKLTFAMSYVATAMNIMPALAPIIGGHLQYWFGWRFIFLFLLIYTVFLLFIFSKKTYTTNTVIQRDLNFKTLLMRYVSVLTQRQFVGYTLPFVLLTGGLLGYYAATPFIFISILHFSSKTFGCLSITTAVAYIVGSTISRYISAKLGMDKTILVGIIIALLAVLISIISWLFLYLNVFTVLLPMTIYALAGGVVSPCSNAGAMNVTRDKAGTSSAVMSAGYYGAWLIFSTIIMHLNLSSLGTLAGYLSVIVVIALLGYWKLILSAKK